jgi:hypothetical protein
VNIYANPLASLGEAAYIHYRQAQTIEIIANLAALQRKD